MRLRLLKAIIFSIFLLLLIPSPILSATQDSQPLRPFPFELTSEEKSRSISDPYLTPYCAQRPTAVQTNRLDKRDKTLTLTVAGDFTSNLSSFITPLLSVTDPDSPHATLSAELKAKGYLADYLEGRAYYEPQAEPQNPNFSEGGFLSRLGVFREVATQTHQSKLKRALIKRAKNDFSLDDNPYGFTPATLSVQNYTIACWNASKNQVVNFQNYDKKNCTSGSPIKLSHFNETNWAPLPEEFTTPLEFASASAKWKIKDGGQKNADGKIIEHGKWSQLWPYVPMFSREDTQGWVRSLPEPGQQNDQVIEKPVIHPHLARTYEVSTAVSHLFSSQSTHNYNESPKLITYWNAPPWTRPDNKDWWIDSGHNESQWSLSAGPVCDPNNTIVASSGDLAKEGIIESSVSKTVTDLENLEYDPNCATTKTIEISPGVYETITDDSDCYINQPVRFSPIYLKTFTPFLNEIINNLVDGPRAFFNTFNLDKEVEPKEGPGVGYPDEPSLAYSFTGGEAEAGMKQPGSPAKFFYKGLGYIQCQKERMLATVQPFLTGKPYTYFSPECQLPPPFLGLDIPVASTSAGLGFPAVCTDEATPLPFPNTASNSVARRAWEIVNNLHQGFWCFWNRSPDYPQNFDNNRYKKDPFLEKIDWTQRYVEMFWCTYLVIKTYQEAGIPISTAIYTPTMAQFFEAEHTLYKGPGLNISNASPGDVVFFQIEGIATSGRWNHVAIIYEVTNEGITTVESNTSYKYMFYPANLDGTFQKVGNINIVGIGSPNP